MPITGRTLTAAGRTFATHLNAVLARTITSKPLVSVSDGRESIYISFRDQGRVTTAELNTKYGPMDLFIGQSCGAVEGKTSSAVNLRTTAYTYTLRPHALDQPLFRWEYVRPPDADDDDDDEDALWCRHHIQGNVVLSIADHRGVTHQVPLNDWHMPTGWVAIEEVIRFCIVDLDVKAESGWNNVLKASYRKFKIELSLLGDR